MPSLSAQDAGVLEAVDRGVDEAAQASFCAAELAPITTDRVARSRTRSAVAAPRPNESMV